MKALWVVMALLFSQTAFTQVACPTGCTCSCPVDPIPEPPKIKWHPGHYMWLDRNNSTPEIRAAHMRQIDAIANEPLRGVKLSLYWAHLESSPGDYSSAYKIIDEYLARLKSKNKYLMLSIQDRQFGGYGADLTPFFPAYIVKDPKYGVTKMQNGITARIWQPATADRLIALSKALAARYDSHPNFEMYQMEETAVAVPIGKDGYTIDGHGREIRRLIAESKSAWKQTLLRLPANFFGSDTQMQELLAYCAANGIAVGGPDIIPNQTIQANRLYDRYFKGRLIWVAEVQSPSLGGHEGTFTAKQIYDSALKQGPSYFVWYRNTWSGGAPQKWDSGLLPFIRLVKGATNTVCPSSLNNACSGS